MNFSSHQPAYLGAALSLTHNLLLPILYLQSVFNIAKKKNHRLNIVVI